MSLILRWLASAAALLLVAYLLPTVTVNSFGTALVAALVIGLVNATLGAVVKFVTTPFRWLTLGLLTVVINAVMFWVAAELVEGFETQGALATLVAAVLYGLIAGLIVRLVGASK